MVLACERPLKPLETRAKMIEESKSTFSALGFSEPVPCGARALDDATDGVNSGVVRGNT